MGRQYFFLILWITVLVPGAFFSCSASAEAAIKDSDFDQLTDESEAGAYKTDPNVFDTDGDGIGDGEEIVSGTNPLDPRSSRIIDLTREDSGILGNQEQWPWYFARATGVLAFVLLTIVSVYGLVISSRAFQKIISGATAYELHRTFSWVALGAVLLHVSSFFFDDFLKISFLEAFVPGVLKRDYLSALGYDMGLAVALGIAGLYFMLILILTSEFRSKLSPKTWRMTHYVSFIAYLAFVAHGVMAGTDSRETWMQILYAASLSIVTTLVLTRILSRTLIPKIRAAWKASAALADQSGDTPPQA